MKRWVAAVPAAGMEIKLRADAPVGERARWLLGFAFRHLNSLSEGDRLNLRQALENFITPPGVSGMSMVAAGVSLLTEGEIRRAQRWLLDGLAGFATQGRWYLKAATSLTLVLTPHGLRDFTFPAGTIPSAEAFRMRAGQVLRDVGPRFRLCVECRRPFIAVKRQEYCLDCAKKRQKAHVSAWRRENPQRVRDLSHDAYVRRKRRDTGRPKLKIDRRPQKGSQMEERT